MIVSDGGDDQLVGAGRVAQLLELVGHLPRRADELGLDAVGYQCLVLRRPFA
jgi:hypothetical protein